MTALYFDDLEVRDPPVRASAIAERLPSIVANAKKAPGWARHLDGVDPARITSVEALAGLPLLRKSDLVALQKAMPPFGGFNTVEPGQARRILMSPGPIFEFESMESDVYGGARAAFATGIRAGDIAINCFSYHLTPGAYILESGLEAIGCAVIPGGVGNTEQQIEAIAHIRPSAYCGTPDFLKVLLDHAAKGGKDVSSLKRGMVSGAALPASLRAELSSRGIDVLQSYGIAETGMIAYESSAREGMIVSEHVLVEIVKPGTGDPVSEGEVGEVVVTSFNAAYPMIRLATGDLSAVLPGRSPCGRTNMRIKGWMGRADQTTKVKGMFVRPDQIADIARRHAEFARLRLVVTRANEQDQMTLHAECAAPSPSLVEAASATLQAVTKMRGEVKLVAPGSLPNDGKVIADERPI